jgi:hypothetical protein
MIHPLILGLLAPLAAVAAGVVPSPRPAPDPAPREAYVYVDYVQTTGDYRRAWVTVRPAHAGGRLPWTGAQGSLHLSLRGGGPRPAGSLITVRRQSDGTYRGFGLVPDPRRLARLFFRADGGRLIAFRVPEVQAADGDAPPPADPPADEPPPADPPADEPADEGCPPIPENCEIYDPFRCECSITRDSWADEAVMTGRNQLVIGV